MKKKLLLISLAVAVLTSLTAGTLAVYTRTVTETEQIEAKRFAFSAIGAIADKQKTINLAPTESMEYNFTIANSDTKGSAVSEVALQYNITIDFAEALKEMPGLTATLYDGRTVIGQSTNGRLTYTTYSKANDRYEKTYQVIITWNDDGESDDEHTAAGSGKSNL